MKDSILLQRKEMCRFEKAVRSCTLFFVKVSVVKLLGSAAGREKSDVGAKQRQGGEPLLYFI